MSVFGTKVYPSTCIIESPYAPCSNYKVKGCGDEMKIGALAQTIGTKAETIRYYERIGLLPEPPRTGGNYRDYGPAELARLRFIRRARDLGFTMAEVRQLLSLSDDQSQSCQAVDSIASLHLREVNRKLADLRKLKTELRNMVDDCQHGSVGECRIIEVLSG